MAWPSGTKASTTNVDQPQDLISQARPDIKQNIDNVNDIIDEFGAGPFDDVHQYNKQQYLNLTTLTSFDSAGGVEWNLDDAQVATITLTTDTNLENPTNQQAGATYVLIVKQDGTGSRNMTFGSAYKFSFGITPTLSSGSGSIDVLTFISDGTNMLGTLTQDFS